MIRIAIFASGSGSNAESIMNYFKDHPEIRVSLILSNDPSAHVLQRAMNHGVSSRTFDRRSFREGEVMRILEQYNIDIIVLAGFLWLVPEMYIRRYPILNIHPALLPKFGGKGLYGIRVHRAVKDAGETESGMTIHEVNEEYDKGDILFQQKCEVLSTDTPEEIAARVLKLEHRHYPRVIEEFATNRYKKS